MSNPYTVKLENCLKAPGALLGKAFKAEDTLKNVREKLARHKYGILKETRRIDTGRLGIPVFMSICSNDIRNLVPVRKQMGKGASAAQAEASAIMELVERHAFFSFWKNEGNFCRLGWKEAKKRFGADLLPEKEMLESVNDNLDIQAATEILNLVPWQFYPATRIADLARICLPADWFRMLGEFNGSSAGNTQTESVLQGICELVERHVCCMVDNKRPVLPTIELAGITDPCLSGLIDSFRKNGIILVLKDLSLGMAAPTVGALAWDPSTFPATSEIVFTAGTATSPVAAAIRAITEVAQLGGDFCTSACYEASGLPKFSDLSETAWLMEGPLTSLASLPDIENDDMLMELKAIVNSLAPVNTYTINTTDPELDICANWTIAPGLDFRERDRSQSLGLFIGRKLAEEGGAEETRQGLELLSKYYPNAHFLPFFRGISALRHSSPAVALDFFKQAVPLQPHMEARAMTSFYAGYALSLENKWQEALPWLLKASRLSPQMPEYSNLSGVACFKLGEYNSAEELFNNALKQNKGSATDLANRGICRKMQGKRDEALIDLQSALELDESLDFAKRHLLELLD